MKTHFDDILKGRITCNPRSRKAKTTTDITKVTCVRCADMLGSRYAEAMKAKDEKENRKEELFDVLKESLSLDVRVLYTTSGQRLRVEVLFEDETVCWDEADLPTPRVSYHE